MTGPCQYAAQLQDSSVCLTLVDKLKLGDDVEPNLRKLVLKHLKKHGKKVVNGPLAHVSINVAAQRCRCHTLACRESEPSR